MGGRGLGLTLCAAATTLAIAAPAHAAEPPTRDCGWGVKISGDQANVLFPDQAAKYWLAFAPIPPGGHVEVKGRYPHARYLSFHTYNRALPIDALADTEIAPDAGSSNPFHPGADRSRPSRSYSLRVVGDPLPTSGRGRTPSTPAPAGRPRARRTSSSGSTRPMPGGTRPEASASRALRSSARRASARRCPSARRPACRTSARRRRSPRSGSPARCRA